jgi:O-antigen ligase
MSRVPTPIDFPAAIFVGYMSISCIMGLFAGHLVSNTFADLVSPLEIYLSFQIAKRLSFPKEVRVGWIKWILVFAAARASWQIFTTLAHIRILAPIYDVSAVTPLGAIGSFTFDRTIDPVSGILFPIALSIYIFDIERRWSLVTAITTAVVLILGLTRSEWVAGVFAVCISMFYAGRLRKALKILAVITLLLLVTFMIWNDLYEALRDRLVTHTIEQFTASQEDLSVGALRILEFNTALEKFQSAPIMGHGLGSWFGTLVSYDGKELRFVQLHNSYLNLLTNTGALGLLLLLIVIFRARRLLLVGLRHSDSTAKSIFCMAASALVWYGIFMAFEPIYAAYHLPVLIGLLWGIPTALAHANSPNGLSNGGMFKRR